MNHTDFMKKALSLAQKGEHQVSPNPAVGAVLVKNGRIIGEGYHQGPGTLHAEIDAIEKSKEPVEGSTLYTTLEPCSSSYPGKNQPPCTERIIREKIREVVISIIDPDNRVNGKGICKLKEAGIEVITGVLEDETYRLNEIFIKNKVEKKPFVHLKIAQTLDGRIATESGDSKWITDSDARKSVHKLRTRYDAILIGAGTALQDDPFLTVRHGYSKKIRRIVIDRYLKLPESLKIFEDQENNPTIVITGTDVSEQSYRSFIENNIKVLKIKSDSDNRIDLPDMLLQLYSHGICSIMVEGGSRIFTSFISEGIYDKITTYIAPRLCGNGIPAIGKLDISKMKDSKKLMNPQIDLINGQIVLTAYRREYVHRNN